MHQVLLLNLDDMHTCMCDNAVFIWLVMLHDYDLFSDPLHRAFYSERKCICRTAFKDTLLLVPGRSWLDENIEGSVAGIRDVGSHELGVLIDDRILLTTTLR